jgi:hypothetical protein
MKVLITGIGEMSPTTGSSWVEYQSELGKGWALWAGEQPSRGETCHVELELQGVLRWGTDIKANPNPGARLESDRSHVTIAGVLEDTRDGSASIRVGQSLLLISTSGEPLAQGSWVRVTAPKLLLYDEGT